MRGYIYLISFENTNDIYIGKTTQDIKNRFKDHKKDMFSTVYKYIKKNNIVNTYIDIIDSIDMNEDLSHLRDQYKYYTNLNNYKLSCLEMFHIHNYIREGKFNIINKKILGEKYVNIDYDNFFLKG